MPITREHPDVTTSTFSTLPDLIVSLHDFSGFLHAEHDAAKIKFKKVEEKIEKCEFLKIVVFFIVKAIIGVVYT